MLGRCARGPKALLVCSMWQLQVHSTVSWLVCVEVAVLPLEQPLESNKTRFGFLGAGWTTSRGFTTDSLDSSGVTRRIWVPMLTISYEHAVVMLQNQWGRVDCKTKGQREASPGALNEMCMSGWSRDGTWPFICWHFTTEDGPFFCM